MKNIVKTSVNKPISVLMGTLIVILLGIISLTKLPLELFPDINLPFAVVVTTYEGKNPYEVEEDVTKPIEQNLLTINNLKTIQSTSREHFSIVIAEFEQSTNMDTAFLDMRESFELLELKEDVGNPMIIKFDPDMMPVMVVSINREWGDISDEEALIKTTEWVKSDVLYKLERIPGVASVDLNGDADTEIQVLFDTEKLSDYNLSQNEVLRIIEDQNIEGLAGVVPDGDTFRMLYIGNKIAGLDGLESIPITYDETNDKIVTLKDLSKNIGFVNAAQNQYMKINGKQGISIAFQKQSNVGITDVVTSIEKTLNEITGSKDYQASYVELLNQGEYIEKSVGSVTLNLIIGSILAVTILFFFLRDIRPTLIVGFAIPISVIGAFALMYTFGISLNIVSMGGLALGIGMLVDNSIVVIENIYRLINEGKSPKEAAIMGAGQVAGAITASTLTTIAVFLPIVFIEGMTAELFTAMALTVTFSLIASLLIAITMVPTLSSRGLKANKKEAKVITKFQAWYENVVRYALRKKVLTLVLILVLLVLSGYLAYTNGFELLPKTDEGTITIDIEMEKGTKFEQTSLLTDLYVSEIMKIDDIETVSAQVGMGGMMSMFGGTGSIDAASITVLLKDERKLSTDEVADKIDGIKNSIDYSSLDNVTINDVYEIKVSPQNTTAMSGFGGTGIQLEIKGDNVYDMRDISEKLVTILKEVEGTKDYDNGIIQTTDVVRIEVNKENAIKEGLTEQDIKKSIEIFYTSIGQSMTSEEDSNLVINVNGHDYKIQVPSNFVMDFGTYSQFLSNVRVFNYDMSKVIENKLNEKDPSFYLYIMTEQGLMLNPWIHYNETSKELYTTQDIDTNPTLASLSDVNVYDGNTDDSIATVIKEAGFGMITRDGKSRILTVTAGIKTGYKTSEVAIEAEEKINNYLNSDEYQNQYGINGYTVDIQGENEDIKQTKNDMIIAGIVAILLVYMVMAIQFQSLKYPLIVMFTIPLAFTGGLLALFFANLPITMVSMVGLIILTGIVVNNGIVLIDYINQLRDSGMSTDEAIVLAGKTRLRPILMTALTTVLALVPMAIGWGDGGELLQPLGVTAIGGLIYATILTLIVEPVMYSLLNRKEKINEEFIND